MGKIEAKGKGSKIKVDEIDLEADGSLATKKKGKIVFARSNRVKHRREGTKKHTIKLGSKFAGLSSDDVKVTKELKKQKREEDEVIEELEATEVTTTDSTKKDLTKSNLIARMKERGCLKSDGTEDATVDTITKAKSKFAKYVRAKKKCLFMLRKAKTVTKTNGAAFDEIADVKNAIKETTPASAEGKTIADSKTTKWALYKSCMEKSRVHTMLRRKGIKKETDGIDLSKSDDAIKTEIKKRSKTPCVYQQKNGDGTGKTDSTTGKCECEDGYEGDECNTEKASNDSTKKADLFEKRVERLAESLEEEEEEEKSSSTVIVDETSTMEIEDGADVEVEGGVTTIRGELDVKEGATLSVKSSAVIDLRSAEEESIDMKADKVMATIQYKYTTDPKKKCDIEKYASVHSEFCCKKNYGKGCEEEEKTIAVSGDLDIKDTATVKVDSLETKGNGRFKVSGRAKMIVSKDPRSKKEDKKSKPGVTLGSVSKDKQEGKSLFEKKTRGTKRIAENVEKIFKDSTDKPTKEILNQKLRDLGAMKSEKAEE